MVGYLQRCSQKVLRREGWWYSCLKQRLRVQWLLKDLLAAEYLASMDDCCLRMGLGDGKRMRVGRRKKEEEKGPNEGMTCLYLEGVCR